MTRFSKEQSIILIPYIWTGCRKTRIIMNQWSSIISCTTKSCFTSCGCWRPLALSYIWCTTILQFSKRHIESLQKKYLKTSTFYLLYISFIDVVKGIEMFDGNLCEYANDIDKLKKIFKKKDYLFQEHIQVEISYILI